MTEEYKNDNTTAPASLVKRLVIREKIWRWFTAKHPEGMMLSKYLLIIRAILFPLDFFYWLMSESRGYQPMSDEWIINGVRYSGEAMRMLARSNGEVYRIKMVDHRLRVERIYHV